MKKLFATLVCMVALMAVSLTAKADNERALPVAQFPQTAQQFIKQNFANQKVVISKVETDFLEKVYVVIFSNGDNVEFYRDGEWKEIECKYSQVPAGAVPPFISKYVSENYPELKANEQFLQLQAQLEGTENRIAVERKKFNETVRAYNVSVRKFPGNIAAMIFGFDTKPYFEAAAGAEQAPKVEF